MFKPKKCPIPTHADKIWSYEQYYRGDVDDKNRRSGHGENHWVGAESLEWYTGEMLMDCMHGVGEYRSRYRGEQGVFVSYEGHLYANRLHGYGAMSYPDGDLFTGLFHQDIRWGPGVLSQSSLREDVGLWRGTQLVRLAWRPTHNVALDLYSLPQGRKCVDQHRKLLAARMKSVRRVNSAIELLKYCGANPILATEKWTSLYPKNCTDLESQLCCKKIFEEAYYKGQNNVLEDYNETDTQNALEKAESSIITESTPEIPEIYYAWNNNEYMVHMLKHSFRHERQRERLLRVDIKSILSGSRKRFKQAGKHELDARTLLMACYLGNVVNVTELINKKNVHPDIADSRGNTALMYAACADQVDIIHFLVEASANVNSFNDNCCTALGVCLVRYACAMKDISASQMLLAILPPPVPSAPTLTTELNPTEWHMERILGLNETTSAQTTNKPTKLPNTGLATNKQERKSDASIPREEPEDTDGRFSEEKKVFLNINTKYSIMVQDLFFAPGATGPTPYLFEVTDITNSVNLINEDIKAPEKLVKSKQVVPKETKGKIKTDQDVIRQISDLGSLLDTDKAKKEMLSKIMQTILQLLSDGANPNMVRCPHPALFIATMSGCPELVRHLIRFRADVNETYPYPENLNYTALDLAVSKPFTNENLNLVRVLLECGAKAEHRLWFADNSLDPDMEPTPGPNLLHVVLARKTEHESDDEIRCQLLKLLLEYRCDPMTRFKGCSAMDAAMSKGLEIFDIFLRCPQTDLNAAINNEEQTILMKLFSIPFCRSIPMAEMLQMVTNLLLFGADPFLRCGNDLQCYHNIFDFIQNRHKAATSSVARDSVKIKPKEDPKLAKKPPLPTKQPNIEESKQIKMAISSVGDQKLAIELMGECARALRVRWLQAKLLQMLMQVVLIYRHRAWAMILPEHEEKKQCGLWLTPARALEIWNTLKTHKKTKIYSDKRVLHYILCMVTFYTLRAKSGSREKLTMVEMNSIEAAVKDLLREPPVIEPSEDPETFRLYVMPELFSCNVKKYDVCFECALPMDETEIECCNCKLVSFCSMNCMEQNIELNNESHPCSEFLRGRYFPTPSDSEVDNIFFDSI